MARISTKYDSDLKEQVLVLRGDEGYARSTKTLLELGNPSIQEDYFDLPVTVNVLRDKDEGTILLYDNDVLLYTIDNWTAQDNARTVTLTGLAFDIQHNIVARYMGNNKCSPSRSTIQTISVEDTRRATSTLTLETGTKQFHYNTPYSDTIILTNTISEEFNNNQSIEIRYDGTLIDTVTTNSEGKASFTIPDVGATGLHNISFHLEATRNLTTYDLSIDLSVGYKIEIINYSKVLVKNNDFIAQARVTDQFGNLFTPSSSEYSIGITTRTASEHTANWSGTVENGIITVNVPYSDYSLFEYPESFAIGISKLDPVKHYMNPEGLIPITYIEPESLSVTSTVPRLYKNETNNLTVVARPPTANIPVVLSGDVSETIYTDENGEATKSLMGTGVGSKTINAQFGSLSESLELLDYIQYWSPGDLHNRDYILDSNGSTSVFDLNNYYRLDVPNTNASSSSVITGKNAYSHLLIPVRANVDFELEIQGVRSNGYCQAYPIIQGTNKSNYNYGGTPANGAFNGGTMNIIRRDGVLKTNFADGSGNVIHNEFDALISRASTFAGFVFRCESNAPQTGRFTQVSFTQLTLQEL